MPVKWRGREKPVINHTAQKNEMSVHNTKRGGSHKIWPTGDNPRKLHEYFPKHFRLTLKRNGRDFSEVLNLGHKP